MKRLARASVDPDPCAGNGSPSEAPTPLASDLADAAERAVHKALGDRERIAPLTLEPAPGDLTLSVCHEIITEVIWQDHEIGEVLDSLEPDRIGHGVKAVEDKETLDMIRERGVTLEIWSELNRSMAKLIWVTWPFAIVESDLIG